MPCAAPPVFRIMQSPPELPLSLPAAAVTAEVALDAVIAGERVSLHAERALHWPRARTLFVADVHLGKAAAFRAGGVPLPRGATAADLARLTRLVERTAATRVVVLGDFFHARAGRVAALDDTFMTWRRQHVTLEMTLVRGNHDARAGDPPPHWEVACVSDPYALPPFLGCHHPVAPRSGYALCGHLHPGIRLHGSAEQSARLPCFVIGRRRAILPAFGRFTGLAHVDALEGDTFVAIAGTRLFRLPPAG
jgi:DNA ligase-associated metallophosphoesterase